MSELGGIDFSNYGSWEAITAPTGAVYYKVPGTGYVYDPFLSASKGKPILWTNPQPSLDERRKQEKLIEQQSSPLNQILPVAGTVGGTIGANYLIDALKPEAAAANAVGDAVKVSNPASQAFLEGAGAASGPTGAETAAAAPGVGIAPYLGAAGAALGGYGVYNATQMEGRRKAGAAGALSGASMGAGLAAAAPLLGLGPLGWGAMGLMALGGAGLGGALGGVFGRQSTKEQQAERWQAIGKEAPNMVDYFAGTGGEQSRDEKFLTADAIRMNPDNYNNVPDWDTWSKENQDRFLSTLLSEGKVTERKGGIYYDDKRAQELANEIRTGQELAKRMDKKNG